jgi:FAD/FMN-containing dehydrogenase
MAVGYHDEIVRPWGRIEGAAQAVARPRHADELAALMDEARASGTLLGMGLNRSYGDSGVNPGGRAISTRGLDRFIAFDPEQGTLAAQAGVSLDEILRLVVPRGWFLPTTPGTRFVTLAGAIANDVHGKNHHRAGSFGRHVRRVGLLRSDLGAVDISASERPELFYATLGGLGLTGLITWAEIALSPIPSGFIEEETRPFRNLSEFFALTAESEPAFEHISAWVDCTAGGNALGRGVMFRGNWASGGALTAHAPGQRLSIPITAPPGLMNGLTLKAFNTAYGTLQRFRTGTAQVHYDKAFYPLDAIGGWNRLYGPRGFYQHQFMAPPETQEAAMAEALTLLSNSGQGSFLAVLKSLGPLRSGGLTSFEGPGLSLALDFPNRGEGTLRLLAQLDEIVVRAGGRVYPAKDARMSPATFKSGYPRWRELEARRDPLFSSGFWRRVTDD